MKQGIYSPYFLREQIAYDCHFSILHRMDICKKYSVSDTSTYKYEQEFPMIHFAGRAERVYLMIWKKIQELKEQKNAKALEEVAKVLSKY